MKVWFKEQAMIGLSLLKEYKKILVNKKFTWLINITLKLVYKRPAEIYFKKVIKHTC